MVGQPKYNCNSDVSHTFLYLTCTSTYYRLSHFSVGSLLGLDTCPNPQPHPDAKMGYLNSHPPLHAQLLSLVWLICHNKRSYISELTSAQINLPANAFCITLGRRELISYNVDRTWESERTGAYH